DVEALRALFTELEFTSLLKELLPIVEAAPGNYSDARSAQDVEAVLRALAPGEALAVAVEEQAEIRQVEADDEADSDMLPLIADSAEPKSKAFAISAVSGSALAIAPETEAFGALKTALANTYLPKSIHDWKSAVDATPEQAIAGVRHDTKLYSYLLDP